MLDDATDIAALDEVPLVSEPLRAWIERYVDPASRLRSAPLFPNPRTGRICAHHTLSDLWKAALVRAGLPHIKLHEGTQHSFATDAFRRGVRERLLQTFLGHASVDRRAAMRGSPRMRSSKCCASPPII